MRVKSLRAGGALVAALLAVPALAACGGSDEDAAGGARAAAEAPRPKQEPSVEKAIALLNQAKSGQAINYKGTKGKTIGVIIPWGDGEGFQANYIGIASRAIEAGYSTITVDAQRKPENGVAAVEDFITKKVDAIVLDPFDSAAFTPAIKKANEAGIPVVAYDQPPTGGELAALFASNNVDVGRGAADLMAQAARANGMQVGDLKVLELLGDLASSSGRDRNVGFDQRAKELGIEIVSKLPTQWDDAKANAAVLDAFQSKPDINAIYMASGCAMWQGVKSALGSLGKLQPQGQDGHVIVISVDGCPAPMDDIRAGYIFGDSTQQLFKIGQSAGQAAVDAINGKTPAKTEQLLPPLLVTKKNVDDPSNWANIVATG